MYNTLSTYQPLIQESIAHTATSASHITALYILGFSGDRARGRSYERQNPTSADRNSHKSERATQKSKEVAKACRSRSQEHTFKAESRATQADFDSPCKLAASRHVSFVNAQMLRSWYSCSLNKIKGLHNSA